MNARPTMQGKQAAEPGGGRPPHAPVRSQRLRRGRCLHRPADGPGGGLPLPRYLPFPAAMQGGRFRPPLGVCGIAGFAGRCKHRPLRTRGKALPGSAGYLWHKAPGGRERPPYNARETGGRTGGAAGRRMPPSARNACVGADACIGPPTGLAGGCLFRVISRSRPQCRAGVFARRLGSAASQGLRDDASIVPYGCRARPCRGLRDTCGARRQCTLALPVSFRVAGSPCRRVPA